MKTAVSLPDELFRRAESTARKLRFSRSQLYAKAVAEFLDRNQSSQVTDRLNEVYSVNSSKLDPALQSAQFKSLGKDSW